MIERRDINVGHICCGLGAGAKGFNRGQARVGNMEAKFVCLGGIDVDPACVADFEQIAGVKGTKLDLMTRGQYEAFHGKTPPRGWREAVSSDIRRSFQDKHPHILFMSMPCKGFSGLLSERISRSAKYQALNGLTLRGLWLALEAYQDDPVELILFENVPRIATRGRWLLDQITPLLQAYGYAVVESKHDCGEIGNLAQHRKRFLLVARHVAKVPAFLYEPPKRPLRGVGEVLGKLPLPGLVDVDGMPLGGPMHRVPRLQWKTWVRLAFVEAGSDWRSLNRLRVENGVLADYGIAPDTYNEAFGVCDWNETSGTITGHTNRPASGKFSVADPRGFATEEADFHGLKVNQWTETAGAVTGQRSPGSSAQSVAEPCGAIPGHPKNNNGPWSVADPRVDMVLPAPADNLVCMIRALDGTWHRPFTTLECAALQSLFDPDDVFDLHGTSDSAKRERIGNAVPCDAAAAIADVMGQVLLLVWSGESAPLSDTPVWVRDLAIALSVKPMEFPG